MPRDKNCRRRTYKIMKAAQPIHPSRQHPEDNQVPQPATFAVESPFSVLQASAQPRTGIALDEHAWVRESDFLAEDVFREVLYFERKRSERSRAKVFLMLVDMKNAGGENVTAGLGRQIAAAIAGITPATRVTGWYRRPSVLGILLVDPGEADSEALRMKIRDCIPAAFLGQVRLHTFPASGTGWSGNADALSPFYPEKTPRERARRLSLALKRLLDIAGGLTGLLLFSPFFLVLPLIIKATSPGPVLFRQERIGRFGRKFTFLKFRTMVVDNDSSIHQEYIRKLIREQKSYESEGKNQGGIYKIKDDPRVTRVGRFLRKSSLDELPQFFNVLRGEMSLVGPRPPIPYELESYDPWHVRRVMEIKPGITGLWQVTGRSSTSFDEMVRLDLQYAQEWSLWLDIKIILKTPWAMLAGKGAY